MSRVRAVLDAERVRCDECGARPYVRCTSESGRDVKPHGQREARLHGLKQAPRRGWFVVPKSGGIRYDADEIQAARDGGFELPKKGHPQ